MSFKVSNIIQKAKFLRSLGCCSVCSLRLSGIPNNDNFHSAITNSDTIKNIFGDSESNQTSEICIICLGILQNEIQNSSVEKISREIKLSGFDSEVFTCTLNIPISVKLREKSISTFLNQKTKESHWNGPNINKYSVKEIWKMLILPKVEEMTSKRQTTSLASSPFSVNIFFSYSNDEIDCENLMKKYLNSLKLTKKQKDNRFSKNNIDKILNDITEEIAMEAFSTPPPQPLVHAVMDKVKCTRESLFVGGRYMKLSRKLSQTPWFVNGQKKMETSVQDILCKQIVNYARAESFKFLSSGREDIDVRTINIGRPFAIELINPKITIFSSETFRKLVVQINDSSELVKISSYLRILSPFDLKKLKEGENVKKKFYRALCFIKSSENSLSLEKINLIKNLKIKQKTPIRVLHRRPLASRDRTVHQLRARYLSHAEIREIQEKNPNKKLNYLIMGKFFIVDIKAQAGTYIKEFIHGDFERTKPNLCDLLGVDLDIVALDVTSINLHWP